MNKYQEPNNINKYLKNNKKSWKGKDQRENVQTEKGKRDWKKKSKIELKKNDGKGMRDLREKELYNKKRKGKEKLLRVRIF